MISKYLKLKRVREGENLYHYTKGTNLLNILQNQTIYATKSSFLNDTNEMDFILHTAAEVIEELQQPAWEKLLQKEIVDTMEDFKRHDIFVLSLSTDKDSITLWAEFGEQTGYSAAFDGLQLIDRIEKHQEIYCHGNVIYSKQRQYDLIRNLLTRRLPGKMDTDFEALMTGAVRNPENKQFREFCRRLQKILNAYAMFFKQEEFSAEREYRIVFRNPDKNRICFREKEGFLLPFIKIDLSGKKKMPLTRVTVAPKNHVDLARKGMCQYLSLQGYQVPVELSQLKLRY